MIAFDAGHGDGANVPPENKAYSEGTTMRQLGTALKDGFAKNGQEVFLTRTTRTDISLLERARRAKAAGCSKVISIHTNYPHDGVLVFYSVNKPQNKALADKIGNAMAKAMGIEYRGARTRLSSHTNDGQPQDWYGIIRNSEARGMDAFIVEHGSHMEFAQDVQGNIKKVVDTYLKLFGGGEVSIINYTVVSGDNLTRIANRHGLEWRDIYNLNNLKTTTLQVGQALKIPVRTSSAEIEALKKDVANLKAEKERLKKTVASLNATVGIEKDKALAEQIKNKDYRDYFASLNKLLQEVK